MPIKQIQTYIAIAVVVAIALIIGFLVYQNKSLTKELKLTQTQLIQAQLVNDVMKVSVEKQNKAVDDMLEAADKNKKEHAAELAKVFEVSRNIKGTATKILTRTITKNSTACDSALALINELTLIK